MNNSSSDDNKSLNHFQDETKKEEQSSAIDLQSDLNEKVYSTAVNITEKHCDLKATKLPTSLMDGDEEMQDVTKLHFPQKNSPISETDNHPDTMKTKSADVSLDESLCVVNELNQNDFINKIGNSIEEVNEIDSDHVEKSSIFSLKKSDNKLKLVDYDSNDSDNEALSQPCESKKRKSEDGESDSNEDEYMDAQGDFEKDVIFPAKRPRKYSNRLHLLSDTEESSSSSSTSESSNDKSSKFSDADNIDDEEEVDEDNDGEKTELQKLEEENWLKKDIKELPNPHWRSVTELRHRQILKSTSFWPLKVCGSRAMVKRFKIYTELDEHSGCVNALHFNHSGSLIASGSDDLRIMLWDWTKINSPPTVCYESGHKSNVFQAKFLPNSNDSTVVSSARDGQVRVADISTTGSCRGTKKIAQHRGSAHKLALDTFANSTFLSCGEDGVVFGIDLRLDKPADKLITLKEDSKRIPLYAIHSNPSRPYEFAVCGRDENARIYDRRMLGEDNTSPVKLYCPHHLRNVNSVKANITCLVYNWDGSELLCTYNDEDIYLFDTNHSSGADYIARYKGHRNNATVKGVNFYGPRSQFIVSGSDCGNVFFWEKESSRVVGLVQGDKGGVVNVLEPHPSLPVIGTSGLDHEVKIWTPQAEPHEGGKLAQLHSLMLSNYREREDERNAPDMIDGHMLWFLMRALRNRHRPRVEDSSSDDDDDSSNNSSSDSDESERMSRCLQS